MSDRTPDALAGAFVDIAESAKPRRQRDGLGFSRVKAAVAAAALLALTVSPFAIAQEATTSDNGDPVIQGKRNGTTTKETEIIANEAGTTANKGGYGTRQSNLSATGGGAIYGCRAQDGNIAQKGFNASERDTEACVRASNLKDGRAFEFSFSNGAIGGLIEAGNNGGDTKKPFITNATGVATGLNADRVDGKNAADLDTRWVLINEQGQIEAQTGGFKLVNCYQANSNCYIDSGDSDVRNNAVHAQIITGNGASDAGTDDQLTGDTSAAPCFFDRVQCGPNGTDDNNGGNPGVFVVTPRNSDGSAPAAGDRYAFYAFVTGSQSG
ncbi:MAG: hypothetical protein ACR2NA_10775 [Solirubrobacterales bacterium]